MQGKGGHWPSFRSHMKVDSYHKTWSWLTSVPSLKKGSKQDAGNYRPVSLTYIPGKIMESIIKEHVVEYLNNQVRLVECSLKHDLDFWMKAMVLISFILHQLCLVRAMLSVLLALVLNLSLTSQCSCYNYNINTRLPHTQNCLFQRYQGPHIIHGSLGPHESTAYRSVQPFLQNLPMWPAHRHTDHTTYVAIGCILTLCTA